MAEAEIDLRAALNAISDIVHYRPPPIREFDQIYMKVGDMVSQALYFNMCFADKDVVFVGDGDSIALSSMHLTSQEIAGPGPRTITLLDFDERIVNFANRFAEDEHFDNRFEARLYNVVDPLPEDLRASKDGFYTNPPWGASNGGESVYVFLERGVEACAADALGMLVIADDLSIDWTQQVLRESQRRAIEEGFLITRMVPAEHLYHLEDAPDLRSCACLFRRSHAHHTSRSSVPLAAIRRHNFYGRNSPLTVRYVRDVPNLNRGKAADNSYILEPLGG